MNLSKFAAGCIKPAMLAVALVALISLAPAQTQGGSYITYHGDLARTGWNARETQLTYEDVDNRPGGQGQFGKIWEYHFIHGTPGVPEQVYSTPLYYNGVVFAATERNWVYALNADDGSLIWERMVDLPVSQERFEAKLGGGCGDINPWHGITSTPVLDSTTETLYVVDLTVDQDDIQLYKMHALDINTGATRAGWPANGVVLGGTYRGLVFDAYRLTQRGGLTLLGGWIYVPFSARCDAFGWNGWILGVNVANPAMPPRAFSTAPDGNGAGIWGGAGISVDEDNKMYVATGNGTFNGNSPNPPNNSFAQSVLKLDPENPFFFERDNKNFYTMPNQGPTNSRDEDMGGSSVTIIPDQSDTPTDTPHLALTSAKDGVVYLLNRDDLGGYSTPNGTQVQRLKLYHGDGSGGAKVAAAYYDSGDQGRFIYLAAGRNNVFVGNYAHWGDANFGMSSMGNPARVELGTGPALAVLDDRIFAAWVDNDGSRRIVVKSSADGRNWSETPVAIGATAGSRTSPALAVFDRQLVLVWAGAGGNLMMKLSEDGQVWPRDPIGLGVQAAPLTSPALAVFDGELYVSWIANDRTIMVKSSATGTDWSRAAVSTNEQSDVNGGAAALGELDGRLYVAWANTDPGPPTTARRLYYKSSPDGVDWTAAAVNTRETINLESRPTLVAFDDLRGQPRLHLLWLSNRSSNRQINNRSLGTDLVTGNFELEPFLTEIYETAFGGTSVGAAAFNGNLHIAFVGNGPNRDLLGKIAQPAFPGRGLVALKLVVDYGKSKLVPVWATPYTFTYNPGSPYVTSDGQDNAIVWVADPNAVINLPVVRGFHAITGEELFNSERRPDGQDRPSWPGRKFGTTTVVDGKLFLGTEGITAYGLLK